MPARPLTRAQRIENDRFLQALSETGNVRLAARSLGLNRSTFTKRRAKHAEFAQRWDAAYAAAHARFTLAGGKRVAEKAREPMIVRRAGGKFQLRLAPASRLTRETEQAFLRALASTANIRLSAAAAGHAHTVFYDHRKANPGFARQWRAALDVGYSRVNAQFLMAADAANHQHDEWIRHELPDLPPMSVTEMLQAVAMHRNTVELGHSEPHRRRRRGETNAQYSQRLFLMWRHEQRNLAEEEAMARAAKYEQDGTWRLEGDWPEEPKLPPLDQVTGWSKAKAKTGKADAQEAEGKAYPERGRKGLFGGWTIDDVEKRRGSGG